MSGDFAISQSAPRSGADPISTSGTAAAQTQDPVATAVAAAAASKRPLVNPSLHLDLALNLVVLQFIDNNGNVTTQIPSQKQLKAYQEQVAAAAPGGSASPEAQWAQGTETAPASVTPASTQTTSLGSTVVGQAGAAQSTAGRSVLAQSAVGSASVPPVRSVTQTQSVG